MRRLLRLLVLPVLASPDLEPDDPLPSPSKPRKTLLRRRLLQICRLVGQTPAEPPQRAGLAFCEAHTQVLETTTDSRTVVERPPRLFLGR